MRGRILKLICSFVHKMFSPQFLSSRVKIRKITLIAPVVITREALVPKYRSLLFSHWAVGGGLKRGWDLLIWGFLYSWVHKTLKNDADGHADKQKSGLNNKMPFRAL